MPQTVPPIDRWLHNLSCKLDLNPKHNVNIIQSNLKFKHICHTLTSQSITYKNAGMIQEHLDEQEHIWNTSGHLEHHRTGQHLQTWHNQLHIIRSIAPLVLPDTLVKYYSSIKFQQSSGIPPMWAPIPKSQNSHK